MICSEKIDWGKPYGCHDIGGQFAAAVVEKHFWL